MRQGSRPCQKVLKADWVQTIELRKIAGDEAGFPHGSGWGLLRLLRQCWREDPARLAWELAALPSLLVMWGLVLSWL